MLAHINPGNGGLPHADSCAAVAGDQTAEELKDIGIVPHSQNRVAVGVLHQHVLEIGEARVQSQTRADLNFPIKSQLSADKLRGLQRTLKRA